MTHRDTVKVSEHTSMLGLAKAASWFWLHHFSMDNIDDVSSVVAVFSRCHGNMLVCGVIT
jgi:hypothetical protein